MGQVDPDPGSASGADVDDRATSSVICTESTPVAKYFPGLGCPRCWNTSPPMRRVPTSSIPRRTCKLRESSLRTLARGPCTHAVADA